ncbi:MAG: sortase [Candidatus Andersenbacteria bacterium]
MSVAEGGQLYRYRVTGSLTVSPSDLSVLDPPLGGQRLLRLMTCWPVGTTLQRLVVEAEFVPRAGG